MVAPTEYRSTDGSAPTLNGTAGALIAVLDAILVNGYGSLAAAGWTKPFTGTNKAVFRQGGGNQRYLRLDDSAAQMGRLVGYASMSDVDTGTTDFPTSAQVSGGLYCRKSTTADSTARPWICWATDKAFLFISCNSVAATAAGTSNGSDVNLYFGDITSRVSGDAYDTLLVAATDTSTTSTAASTTRQTLPAAVSAGKYMPANYASTPGSVNMTSMAFSRFGIGGSSGNNGVTPQVLPSRDGKLDLCDLTLIEGTNIFRGKIPGIFGLANLWSNATNWSLVEGRGASTGREFRWVVLGGNTGILVETNGGWL